MTQRIVYENLEPGIHISLAAKAALQYFGEQRAPQLHLNPPPQAEYVFIFNDTSVQGDGHDTVDSLVTRWLKAHEENYEKAQLRRAVRESNPELDELMPMLSLTTAVGLGNTLDWIKKFSAIADDSVVEAFGKEVLGEFENRGYTPNEPLPGNATARREEVSSNKEAYGRYVVGLFLFELSKGRAIERKFDRAVALYDSMCPLSH